MKQLFIIVLALTLIGCEKEAGGKWKWKTEEIQPTIVTTTKNYLKSSYELSNFEYWYGSNDVFENGVKYTFNNPLTDMQPVQLDLNQDGIEDIFSYDGYDLKINPTPNPPPVIYYNKDNRLNRQIYTGPEIRNPHGTKMLLGDFNNDSIPDIFSLVAVDQPIGVLYPSVNDNCHLIFNSKNGLNRVLEIDLFGFWFAGCSGDIDNDGDLDIIMFNMHQTPPIGNKTKNRILFNDGLGNFKQDSITLIEFLSVTDSELFDINQDGFLDLILNSYIDNKNELKILWGNGKSFSAKNGLSLQLKNVGNIINLDFININKDLNYEIIVSHYSNDGLNFKIELLEFNETNNVIINNTQKYFDNNSTTKFGSLRVQDIDKNGYMDIFSNNKSDNIRWEWNGTKFYKK